MAAANMETEYIDEELIGNEIVDIEAVQGYQFEPSVPVDQQDEDEDVIVRRQQRQEIIQEYADTSKWCSCQKCQAQPTREQNRCCQSKHKAKAIMQGQGLTCFTEHEFYNQVLLPGPLHLEYLRYTQRHGDTFNPSNSGDLNKKLRFLSYRTIIGWLYPGLKKGERKPLPACVYSEIQARFPPTDDDEEFADWRFSEFTYA